MTFNLTTFNSIYSIDYQLLELAVLHVVEVLYQNHNLVLIFLFISNSNFNRKSVIGLNLDFVALNTTGYLAYAVYNICLATVDGFQQAYFKHFKGSQIPVQLNDILFASHGFVVNVLICVQCIFYERGDQELTQIAKGILIAVYSPAAVLTLLFSSDGLDGYYYITFFSYVKLLLTLCKYFPQVSIMVICMAVIV